LAAAPLIATAIAISSYRRAPRQSISCRHGAVKKSFADRSAARAGPLNAGGDA
jgi:hypothetical protein